MLHWLMYPTTHSEKCSQSAMQKHLEQDQPEMSHPFRSAEEVLPDISSKIIIKIRCGTIEKLLPVFPSAYLIN